MIKSIGVLTSGGDAPGMNTAVRAVVRTALTLGIEVYGIQDGYEGLYHNKIIKLESKDVSGILNQGGTFLGSARFPQFKEEEIRKEAIRNLDKHGIEALVIVGGDGSFMGGVKLSEMGYPCIGIPGTIDNDAPRTDYTIGFDTALNTIVEAADKLRDTSGSHRRCSVMEVMGRDAGDLALHAGIASGAEFTIIPEVPVSIDQIIEKINVDKANGKKFHLIILAEGVKIRDELVERIEQETGIETRATILGHIQRGGCPSGKDRVLASAMGAYAVELLTKGEKARCVGIKNNLLTHNDIIEAISDEHTISAELVKIANEYLNN